MIKWVWIHMIREMGEKGFSFLEKDLCEIRVCEIWG